MFNVAVIYRLNFLHKKLGNNTPTRIKCRIRCDRANAISSKLEKNASSGSLDLKFWKNSMNLAKIADETSESNYKIVSSRTVS